MVEKKAFKKGNQLEIEIIDVSDMGQGIGKIEGFIVFVDDVVVGDLITTKLTKVKKNYAFGQLLKIIKPSKYRMEPSCPYSHSCGGCFFSNTDYKGQLKVKKKQFKDKLMKIGEIKNPKVNGILSMEEPFHYRNKAKMQISTGGNIKRKGGIIESLGEPQVGFYKIKSHELVDCKECLLQSKAAIIAADVVRTFMKEDNVTAWDQKWEQGLMKTITVKTAFGTKEVMVILEINGKGIPNSDKLIGMLDDSLYDGGYNLESVFLDTGKDMVNIAGRKVIKEEMGELKFEISPNSFYQVNPAMTEVLYNLVKEYAGLTGEEFVLDLYCGVGSIGLWCADKAKYVLGIESVKEAVLDANRNATINQIVNARYLYGKAEDELPKLLRGEGDEDLVNIAKNADVVILDPPRAGCREELLDSVIEVSPSKIIYVSCDPATLARDIKKLKTGGYEFIEGTPVDVFPWTRHVEGVCLLRKVEG